MCSLNESLSLKEIVECQAIRVIKEFVNALKREGITIDRVILYGSYAKGNVRPDSNIDVAVISKDFGKDRVEEGMVLFRIAGKIDPRLEPVPFSKKMYEDDTWILLIYEIREKGEELKIWLTEDLKHLSNNPGKEAIHGYKEINSSF